MSIFDSIDQRLDTITDRITTSGEAFASLLDTRIATLTQSTDDVTRSLSHMLDERTNGMVSLLGGAARRSTRSSRPALNEHREDACRARPGADQRVPDPRRGARHRHAEAQRRAGGPRPPDQRDAGRARARDRHDLHRRQARPVRHDRRGQGQDRRRNGRHRHVDFDDAGGARLGFADRLEASRSQIGRLSTPISQRLSDARAGIDAAVESHAQQARREPRAHGRRPAAGRSAEIRRQPRRDRPGASAGTSRSWPKAAPSSPGRSTTTCARSPSTAPPSTPSSGASWSGCDAGRDALGRALSDDLQRLGQTRAQHRQMVQRTTSPSSPRGATCLLARSKPTSTKLDESRTGIDTSSPARSTSLPRAATSCPVRWKRTSRSSATAAPRIDGIVAGQVSRWRRAATSCPARWRTTSKAQRQPHRHRQLVAGQVEKLAQGRDILSARPADDLRKSKTARRSTCRRRPGRRSSRKGVPCSPRRSTPTSQAVRGPRRHRRDDRRPCRQAGRGPQHADARPRGRSAQARRTRADIDDAVAAHIQTLADRRADISEALSADVEKIEEAFRRQTGVIEERTGTMERALSTGIDNVRSVLERSAGGVAAALRDKVLEVTAALSDEAGKALSPKPTSASPRAPSRRRRRWPSAPPRSPARSTRPTSACPPGRWNRPAR